MGKASGNKGHNFNKLTPPPPPPKIEEIPPLQSIAPQPFTTHSLKNQKRRKKLDEVMMCRARLSKNEFGEEENMRIVKNYGAVIDMGCGTISINDGVIRHTYFLKPKAKAYLENFEINEEDDWLSCFEVGRDEDGHPKYGPMEPSFFDIEDEIERALAMEAYFNPFKNIIVFKKLIDFLGSLLIQLKNTDRGNEGYGMYKKIEGYSFDETSKELMKMDYLHDDGDVYVDYSLERALSIEEDVYPEWCLEFFSTMYFERGVNRTKLMTEKCVWLRLCGREHVLILPNIAPWVDGDVEDVGDLGLRSIEDEEVPMVDGVFEGEFGALGDKTRFGNGSSSGCHGGLWWLITDEEDDEVMVNIWKNLLEENSLEMNEFELV
nr:hypothetical protein [Tanacetum cinerariifolium]